MSSSGAMSGFGTPTVACSAFNGPVVMAEDVPVTSDMKPQIYSRSDIDEEMCIGGDEYVDMQPAAEIRVNSADSDGECSEEAEDDVYMDMTQFRTPQLSPPNLPPPKPVRSGTLLASGSLQRCAPDSIKHQVSRRNDDPASMPISVEMADAVDRIRKAAEEWEQKTRESGSHYLQKRSGSQELTGLSRIRSAEEFLKLPLQALFVLADDGNIPYNPNEGEQLRARLLEMWKSRSDEPGRRMSCPATRRASTSTDITITSLPADTHRSSLSSVASLLQVGKKRHMSRRTVSSLPGVFEQAAHTFTSDMKAQ